MSEPTIEEMIDIVIRQSRWVEDRLALQRSRSALLSRIASIQKEADEWHKMADKLHPRIAHEPDCRSNIDGIFHCNCGADDVDDEFCALTQRYSHKNDTEPSNSDVSVTKDVLTTIKTEGEFVVCQKCRTIVPPQMMRYQMYYCPNCGRKIIEKDDVSQRYSHEKEGEGNE